MNENMRNLMMGSCYIKHALPGPVRLHSVSAGAAGPADWLEAGSELVKTGYLRQRQAMPDAAQELDDILGSFELTPFGIERLRTVSRRRGRKHPSARWTRLPW